MTPMNKINENPGFTLIEMILVLVLMSILGVFTFEYLTSSLRTFKNFSVRKERNDDASLALERMSREIRDARLSTVNNTTPNSLIFTRRNTENMQDSSPTVKFFLHTASGELRRQSAGGVYVLARNVQDFITSLGPDGTVSLTVLFSSSSGDRAWQTTACPRNS